MTLTSPMCPSAATLPYEVEQKVRQVPGVKEVKLELVWDPPYHPSMMSDAARIQLGFFD
jgi:metal-sulfur cluster biosynthetic enzyme